MMLSQKVSAPTAQYIVMEKIMGSTELGSSSQVFSTYQYIRGVFNIGKYLILGIYM